MKPLRPTNGTRPPKVRSPRPQMYTYTKNDSHNDFFIKNDYKLFYESFRMKSYNHINSFKNISTS